MSSWICCQIGAREHYAVPRALHQSQKLFCLITDAWVPPLSPLKIVSPSGLKERFHSDLSQVKVHAFNKSLINFEVTQKLQKRSGWEQTITRNHWFQKRAIDKLTQLASNFSTPPILFSYSYAALELFRFAKKQGWYTVLGQIDPGISEELIVAKECQRYPHYQTDWKAAPSVYWQNWQEECNLADSIVINSDWSRQLLEDSGIAANKLKIIPLVYNPPKETQNFIRSYPESFNHQRPLRVLFLGQVILRKGIVSFLEAIKYLEGYPVEFWIVGTQQIQISEYFQSHSQIRWIGHINRSETSQYYQLADVFLFPTLSDGFGLTQLEAQAWLLPVIASKFCGEVVEDGVNGLLLSEVTGQAIAEALKLCLINPEKLKFLAENSTIHTKFSFVRLEHSLHNLSCFDV